VSVRPRQDVGLRNADLLPEVTAASLRSLRVRRIHLAGLATETASGLLEQVGRLVVGVATPDLPAGTGWMAEEWAARGQSASDATLWTATLGDALVGCMFVSELELDGTRALFLQSAYVHPALQGRGVGFALNARMALRELLRHPFGSRWVVAALMSPVALAGWRSRLSPGAAYPGLGDTDLRPELTSVAAAAAAQLYPTVPFDPATGVLHGRTPPRSGRVTPSGDQFVDAHFEQHVDPAAGDAVLMVLDGRRSEVVRCLGRVPGALLRSISVRAGSERGAST
jgi:L-amino acid N-acyltransferase YncA